MNREEILRIFDGWELIREYPKSLWEIGLRLKCPKNDYALSIVASKLPNGSGIDTIEVVLLKKDTLAFRCRHCKYFNNGIEDNVNRDELIKIKKYVERLRR